MRKRRSSTRLQYWSRPHSKTDRRNKGDEVYARGAWSLVSSRRGPGSRLSSRFVEVLVGYLGTSQSLAYLVCRSVLQVTAAIAVHEGLKGRGGEQKYMLNTCAVDVVLQNPLIFS